MSSKLVLCVLLGAMVALASAQCDVTTLISTNEGYSTCVYTDTTGHPTIGIGFNLDRSDAPSLISSVGADYNSIVSGSSCLTDSQVMQLFQNDVANAQSCAQNVDASFWGGLSAGAQSVVTDLIFNLGCSGYQTFTTFNSYLANYDYTNAANDLMYNTKWCGQVGTRCTRDCNCLTS